MLFSTVKKIFSILDKKQKRNFVFLIFVMVIAGVLESFSLSLLIPSVSFLLDTNAIQNNQIVFYIASFFKVYDNKQLTMLFLVALLFIYVFKNIFLYFQCILQNNYVYNNRARFFQKVYSEYLKRDYPYFIKNQSGDIVRTIYNDVFNVFSALSSLLTIITQIMLSFLVILLLLFVQPIITAIATLILLIQASVINFVLEPKLVKKGKVNNENIGKFYSNIIQTIECIKEIKIFNKEKFFINKTNNLSNIVSQTDKKNSIFGTIPKLFFETFTICSIILFMIIIVYLDYDMKNLIPTLSVFGAATMKLLPAVNSISASVNNISYYHTNIDNVVKLVKENSSKKCISSNYNVSYNTEIPFTNKISLVNVSFSYDDNKQIFDSINFEVNCNSCIGIIGKSGAGKSTLVDLILGLLKPNEGKILCDDIDIELNYTMWLSHIGYIPQNTCLINDSILNNIAFGIDGGDIDFNNVNKAVEDSQLTELINNLPEGLNTQIGERGVLLSGGQRQRIGIARAIYNNPKILIFDEATSSLDNETELNVMNAINSFKNKKTMIIIAHRLSTLSGCDKIYKIEDKKIIETIL